MEDKSFSRSQKKYAKDYVRRYAYENVSELLKTIVRKKKTNEKNLSEEREFSSV